MVKFIGILLVLGFANTPLVAVAAAPECLAYVSKSRELQCDFDNYLIRFGYHYCQIFSEKLADFSKRGQPIVLSIRQCLIDGMQADQQMTCQNSKENSENEHVGCYIQNGFCSLGIFDMLAIYNIVYPEMNDPGFRRTMRAILSGCGSNEGDREYDLFFKTNE